MSASLRVVISGAARGVGLACACAFAECGADLILCDIDGTALTQVAEMVAAFSRYCDVASETSIAVFAQEVAELFPSIDVVINAAGNGYVRSLGMMRMSRALLPLLRKASGRRFIFNLAPAGGLAPRESIFPYAGSRQGFDRLSDALADQVNGTAICVLGVSPKPRHGARLAGSIEAPSIGLPDDDELAARIVRTVTAARPEWRHRRPRQDRRA
jgi:NAD(P)-dependent dehydrogenase (short-subunit alcohol dehydrogenase family)